MGVSFPQLVGHILYNMYSFVLCARAVDLIVNVCLYG